MDARILTWWNSMDPFTEDEKARYHQHKHVDFYADGVYSEELNSRLMKNLLGIVPEDFEMRCGESGTYMITQLFENYVDDDTLVISTNREHPSVLNLLSKCKNHIAVGIETETRFPNAPLVRRLIQEAKKYKKVFVYMIGLNNQGCYETNLTFHKLLKDALTRNRIHHTYVYDDVQGMFILPRDYSIFDFVVCTAHAAVEQFDLGMVFHKRSVKKDFLPGTYSSELLRLYLPQLEIVLKRRKKIDLFEPVIRMHFDKFDSIKFLPVVAPFRCVIHSQLNLLQSQAHDFFEETDIAYTTSDDEGGEFRELSMRALPYVNHPWMFELAMDRLEFLLSNT